ncbi:MAG: histidinol dehydrogenase [Infirmifilum sp.]|uniref:histidinol dehydrogenase n=2 Tax=Thermoprotei TaxID=183924 RepID=UPI003D1373AA
MAIRVVKLREADPGLLTRIKLRSRLDISGIRTSVEEIMKSVRERGDKAILEFYERFYGKRVLESLRVSENEFKKARSAVSERFIKAVEYAAKNIKRFHEEQKPKDSWFIEIERGVFIGQVTRPIESVGVYVPGGKAFYPSTALMTVIPAQVAGVSKIVATTPPAPDGSVDPHILVVLDYLGVREVFKVGGAHAVAALAFGTESVPRVEKITGPGGLWFTAAKQIIKEYTDVDIDFLAGPSEILVIADETADPEYVARDLISQLEHDEAAAAVLVTPSPSLAERVKEIVETLVEKIPRSDIVKKALEAYSAIVVTDSLDEAIEFANDYAPEHLEVHVSDSLLFQVLSRIKNAGSIFIGKYGPVPLGDYVVGTNHVLPTGGWAKKRGSLGALDFMKLIDVTYVADPTSLEKLASHLKELSLVEGLPNHYEAVRARVSKP